MNCLFKKNNNQKDDKLLLLCIADSSGVYQFDFSENSYNDLNILYSFKISKTQLTEKVVVTDQKGTIILSVHPNSLDFTSQDKLTIKYQTENPDKLKTIKLNYNSTKLECKDNNNIKECTVPQSHFKESGYYYTYYTNDLGHEVISYEIPKIQITLKKDDGGKSDEGGKSDGGNGDSKPTNLVGIIVGSVVGGLVLIAIIVFIIIYVKKKKGDSIEIISGKGENNLLPNSEQVELVEGIN